MKATNGRAARLLISAVAVSLAAAGLFASPASAAACAKDKIQLIQSGRGFDNPYYVTVDAGAKAFAKSVGLSANYQWIASDGDSQKQLSQIKSLLSQHGNCAVINVDPNESSILPAILDAAKAAGASVVVQWNRPQGVTPLKYGPTFVSFMSEDGVAQGAAIAEELFKAMGGKGNIIALQGMLDNTVAQARFKGLQNVMKKYPGIKLLADQTAKWDQNEGQKVTAALITKYGKKINGVWTANDSMGLGALQALRQKRMNVPVVGIDGLAQAMKEIARSDGKRGFIATTIPNAAVQGGFGLAIGYAAATGAIDVAKLKPEQRAFYMKTNLATKKNIKTASKDITPTLKFNNIWANVASVIPENV